MPYINPIDREMIDPYIEPLSNVLTEPGQLNYAITRLLAKYVLNKGLSYSSINAVTGVLQKVAAEFDVRVTRPYEELKIWQNGDIPEFHLIESEIRDDQRKLPVNIAPDNDQVHG